MAEKEYNLDDILVDDILAGLQSDGIATDGHPDDADVDEILASLAGKTAQQKPSSPEKAPAYSRQTKAMSASEGGQRSSGEEAQETAKSEKLESQDLGENPEMKKTEKKKRRRGKQKEEQPEGYWGDIKGITEKEGPSAQEVHLRRVEEKMRAYQKAHERQEQKGLFGRKVRTEQMSRSMDLPVVNPVPQETDDIDRILEAASHQTQEEEQKTTRTPVLRVISNQKPAPEEDHEAEGEWQNLLSDEGTASKEDKKEEPDQPQPSDEAATVYFSQVKEPETAEEYRVGEEGEVVEREPDAAEVMQNQLNERREQVKSEFKIGAIRLEGEEEEEDEPGNVDEEPEEEAEEIEDFSSYDDTLSVNREFAGLTASLAFRLVGLSLLFLFSLYLTFSAQFDLMIPDFLSAGQSPMVYTGVHFAVILAGVALSAKTVFSGLGALFTGKANSDSVASTVCLATLIESVTMFFFTESVMRGRVVLYSAAAILALLVNTVGKLYIINRTKLNFKLVSTEDYVKRVAMEITNEEMLQYIPHDSDLEDTVVCAPVKTDFLANFLHGSYMRDITDRVCRWSVPVIALCSLVVAVLSYFVFQNTVPVSVSVFSAGICICAPICAVLNTNIPLFLANSSLVRSGAMITNYEACEKFGDVGSLVMDLSDLLPEHAVKLHSIKTFKEERIDEVLLEVASLTHSVSHPLSKMFLQIVDDRYDLLKPVESVIFEENMGISGWVENQRVLLGNRDMMTNHGVLIPGKDFERKYLAQGYDLIYFSRGGKIAAIFIVQYEVSEKDREVFGKLEREGIRVYVRTYDANISDKKLSEMYGTESGTLTVLPFRAFRIFDDVCGKRKEADASIAYTSDISSFIRALLAAMKVKNAANLSNLLMLCSMGLGLLLVALLVLFGAMSRATIMTIMAYQLFWMVLLLIVLHFNRY